MGSAWSSARSDQSPPDLEAAEQPKEPKDMPWPWPGDVVPSICSPRREDYYYELYDEIYFVEHTNQECIVVFQICQKGNSRVDPEDWFAIVDRVPRVYEYLAHSTNGLHADIDQPIDIHPRIVK